jgi:hypothetical protein
MQLLRQVSPRLIGWRPGQAGQHHYTHKPRNHSKSTHPNLSCGTVCLVAGRLIESGPGAGDSDVFYAEPHIHAERDVLCGPGTDDIEWRVICTRGAHRYSMIAIPTRRHPLGLCSRGTRRIAR